MSDEFKYDPVKFAAFCVETYRAAKGLSGLEVADLFDRHGVFGFIEECGDVLHCQGETNTVADIDDYIANHRKQFTTNDG